MLPVKRVGALSYVFMAILSTSLLSPQAAVATHCPGDCNDDGTTNVSEIIRCVRSALELQNGNCDSCDRNADGRVGISELIQAVNAALRGCPPRPTPTDPPTVIDSPTPSATNTAPPTRVPTPIPMGCRAPNEGEAIICGDGICMAPEQCDLGGICTSGSKSGHPCTKPDHCPEGRCTVVGGQALPDDDTRTCAANCTVEKERTARISESSTFLIQTGTFQLVAPCSGIHTMLTGEDRADDTVDINGETTFASGDIPITTQADGLQMAPIPIAPLVCICIRGLGNSAFGPGNSGAGVASCGQELAGAGYKTVLDHRTDPIGVSSSSVEECALPADPECQATTEPFPGVTLHACREGIDADCRQISNTHRGACISPKVTTRSGSGPLGSAFLWQSLSISLLQDNGRCSPSDCNVSDYGPDCIPCTDDDTGYREINVSPLTTGTANGVLWNAGATPGEIISEGSQVPCQNFGNTQQCGSESQCDIAEVCQTTTIRGSLACGIPCGFQTCRTVEHGMPLSCSQLRNQASNRLRSGALALSWPSVDRPTLGDNVTTLRMVHE